MQQRQCRGLEIAKEPLCCAVSITHPLASKERLRIEDLYGQKLMIIHSGWCENMDILRNDLISNHPEIKIKDFDLYNLEIFNQCEQSKDILISLKSWDNLHPLIKVIPVDWNYKMPYGIMYSPEPSKAVKQFLEALTKELSKTK